MDSSPPRRSRPIDELVSKVRHQDSVIETQQREIEKMADDYKHNLGCLADREERVLQLEEDLRDAQGRHAALDLRLREIEDDDEHNANVFNHRISELEKKLEYSQSECSAVTTRAIESEKLVSQLRMELNQAEKVTTQRLQSSRHELVKEYDERIVDMERKMYQVDDDHRRIVAQRDTDVAQMTTELHRQRSVAQTAEAREEALQKQLTSKDQLIHSLRGQLESHDSNSDHKFDQLKSRLRAVTAANEEAAKVAETTIKTLTRDLEKRNVDYRMLEDKVSGLVSRHEHELKRRKDELDDSVETFEGKLAAANEQLRRASTGVSTTMDDRNRFESRLRDAKRDLGNCEERLQNSEDRIEELVKQQAQRDRSVSKLTTENEKLHGLLADAEKSALKFRSEFERRDWQDRTAADIDDSRRMETWQKYGETKLLNASTASGVAAAASAANRQNREHQSTFMMHQQPPAATHHNNYGRSTSMAGASMMGSAPPSPIHDRHRGGATHEAAAGGPSPTRSSGGQHHAHHYQPSALSPMVMKEFLDDLKDQFRSFREEENQQQQANNTTVNGTASDQRLVASELALLREQQSLDKLEAERRISDLTRESDRQRRRVDRLKQQNLSLLQSQGNSQHQAASPNSFVMPQPQQPAGTNDSRENSSGAGGGVPPRAPSPAMRRVEEMRSNLERGE